MVGCPNNFLPNQLSFCSLIVAVDDFIYKNYTISIDFNDTDIRYLFTKGVPLKTSTATYTYNISKTFKKPGSYVITATLNNSKYPINNTQSVKGLYKFIRKIHSFYFVNFKVYFDQF